MRALAMMAGSVGLSGEGEGRVATGVGESGAAEVELRIAAPMSPGM